MGVFFDDMNYSSISAGRRIRRHRETKGISRSHLARLVGVDVTAVSAWETDKYRPRVDKRLRLASTFGVAVDALFPDEEPVPVDGPSIRPIDDFESFACLLLERTSQAERIIRAIHCSRCDTTRTAMMVEFRTLVSERLLAGTLAFDHIEMIYSLSRLKEVIWNIFRYEGRPYRMSAYCVDPSQATMGPNAFIFDERELLLGSDWQDARTEPKLRLALSTGTLISYFQQYWSGMWQGGVVLNAEGPRDLSSVRTLAIKLGLPSSDWPSFLEEARALATEDGAAPFV